MLQRHGRLLALYHDRHGIFQQTGKASEADTLKEQLVGKQDPIQFELLLEELEITSIAARSPQAKGRVERLFGIDARSPGHRTPRSQVRAPASRPMRCYRRICRAQSAQFAVEPAQAEPAWSERKS